MLGAGCPPLNEPQSLGTPFFAFFLAKSGKPRPFVLRAEGIRLDGKSPRTPISSQ
jgi:hypothetical protein